MMTEQEKKEIRVRCQDITPGPWTYTPCERECERDRDADGYTDCDNCDEEYPNICGGNSIKEGAYINEILVYDDQFSGMYDRDAEFITHAREDVPKLLDALEESEAALERSESSHALKNARIADLEAERDSWRKRADSFEDLYGKCRNKFRPAEAEPQVQEVTE